MLKGLTLRENHTFERLRRSRFGVFLELRVDVGEGSLLAPVEHLVPVHLRRRRLEGILKVDLRVDVGKEGLRLRLRQALVKSLVLVHLRTSRFEAMPDLIVDIGKERDGYLRVTVPFVINLNLLAKAEAECLLLLQYDQRHVLVIAQPVVDTHSLLCHNGQIDKLINYPLCALPTRTFTNCKLQLITFACISFNLIFKVLIQTIHIAT